MTASLPCSVQWSDPTLPVWGTAPRAAFWVALEQNGAWSARAWTQSSLDPEVGAAIEQACLDHGGRGVLVRDPVAHAETQGAERRVFVAGGLDATPWLLTGTVGDPEQLIGLPWDQLASGSAGEVAATLGWLAPQPAGVLLVCGNGRRDACCARTGGPLARLLSQEHPGRVWESSHLGGHRFAPTALVLPTGQALGRVSPMLGGRALASAASGRALAAGPEHDRGRSWLGPADQVVDAFVRWQGGGDPAQVTLERVQTRAMAESCGAPMEPAWVWHARWAGSRDQLGSATGSPR